MDLEFLLGIRKLLTADGAMGTALAERGLPAGATAALWNVERPADVAEVHRGHLRSGAECILTNTFGGNAVALAAHGLADRTEELNRAAAEVARQAAADRAVVLGDIGPTGALVAPYGDLSAAQGREAFRRQASALAQAGVDAVLCETFQSAEELRLALEAAVACCDLPLIACMTFAPEPSGRYRSMMGEGPEDLVRVAEECGCAVIGTNCGQGIQTMPALVARLADLTDRPILVKPNAGLPQLVNGRTVYREDPAVFRRYVPVVYEAGARIIGGCDGTTAEHVRAIREFADTL